jgi:ankyrin repeat protein
MKMIRALILAAVISVPMSAFAQVTDDEQVVFTEALRDGNVKVVKQFLAANAGVNDLYFAWSALQIAANKGQLEVVKVLIDKGADINYQHPISKNTALHLAALNNYPEVVTYLISKGADANIKLRADVSIIRVLKDEGNTKMVEILMAAGAKDDGCQGECF